MFVFCKFCILNIFTYFSTILESNTHFTHFSMSLFGSILNLPQMTIGLLTAGCKYCHKDCYCWIELLFYD